MNGVAAKIAQEVLVLLKDDDIDTGARQQHAEHHSGRTATDDRAGRANRFCHPVIIVDFGSGSKPDVSGIRIEPAEASGFPSPRERSGGGEGSGVGGRDAEQTSASAVGY